MSEKIIKSLPLNLVIKGSVILVAISVAWGSSILAISKNEASIQEVKTQVGQRMDRSDARNDKHFDKLEAKMEANRREDIKRSLRHRQKLDLILREIRQR